MQAIRCPRRSRQCGCKLLLLLRWLPALLPHVYLRSLVARIDRWALATLSVSVEDCPMRAEVPDAGRHVVAS